MEASEVTYAITTDDVWPPLALQSDQAVPERLINGNLLPPPCDAFELIKLLLSSEHIASSSSSSSTKRYYRNGHP